MLFGLPNRAEFGTGSGQSILTLTEPLSLVEVVRPP